MTGESLGSAEIEGPAIGVDVGEVDVVEIAGFDARLHEAVAAGARSAFTADALRAAEVEPAAVGVDAVEADAVEIAAAEG